MAAVMLMGAMSVGMIGLAADADMDNLYYELAEALKNKHVADLSNYTVSNNSLNNGAEGFDSSAKGFAYEHRVTAYDDSDGDILKAANLFYCLAENLMSTEYGVGIYDPEMLVTTVSARLKEFFAGSTSVYYEDFYGEEYFPTQEEIDAYENALSLLEAVGREPTQASLSSFRIYFMKKDEFSFYHVDTILQYFVGNVLRINAGNWYHRYSFVIDFSVDSWLTEMGQRNGNIASLSQNSIPIRKAVYEFDYERTFNETQTKAFYAFKQPSLETVYQNYGEEFGFNDYSDDLRAFLLTEQAEAFMIRETTDDQTVPKLRTFYLKFAPIKNAVNASGETWDAAFAKMNENQLSQQPNAADIISHIDELGDTYSNDALLAMFGENIGNMISYAYILKPMSMLPERTVRGNAKYTVTAAKLNNIVTDIDNLVHNPYGDTATRVATIVKQFFNTDNELFAGSAVAGMEFDDLKELVSLLLNGLLFRDGIINKLVGLLYPLVCNLVDTKLLAAVTDAVGSTISGWLGDILSDLLENNDLAIYPKQLGNRIALDHPDHEFDDAVAVLRAAGNSWDNVNMDALSWGVDDAPLEQKASKFTDAICTALGGFRLLLITVMCGDAEYKNDRRKKGSSDSGLSWLSNGEDNGNNQFTEYYDKLLINIGQQGIIMRSQGGYTKLIIPLLRLFGLRELTNYELSYADSTVPGYLSPKAYHDAVDADGDNCLKMIVKPIVYWATQVLASQPFTELWKLLPNLIYFFTRTGTVTIADDWCDGTSNDNSHDNFTTCQTWSLATIMAHLHVKVTGLGINIYHESVAGFLGDKMAMLRSLNGLLNQFVDMKYIKGLTGEDLPCAYANGNTIVLKDSVEYVSAPAAYPEELLYCYTYDNSYTPDAGVPQYVREEDELHHVKITNPNYNKVAFKIPQIQEKKITSTTTERSDGTLVDPNAIGVLNTAWNTIDVRNPGVVLLYVLRFVISSLGYKYDISDDAADQDLPYLVECLMRMNKLPEQLKDERTGAPVFDGDGQPVYKDVLDKELFQGLNLQDIIYNVMLHPDQAIAALLELFYSNEQGDRYSGLPYTYSIKEINYHNSVLLNTSINPTLTYGTAVRYTQYWTREYAQSTLAISGELITNILVMLGNTEFADGFGPYLEKLLNEKVFNNEIVNKAFNVIYKLLGGLNDRVGFDIATVLKAVYDITYDPYSIGMTLERILGYETPASNKLKASTKWTEVFTAYTETSIDPITQQEVTNSVISDVNFDWGVDTAKDHGLTNHEAFLRVMSALLSPAAFLFRYLFADENIKLLGLVELDAYAGYHYAWIGLLEALSCPGVMTYKVYYESTLQSAPGTKLGDAYAIYNLLSPVVGLIDKIYADPITTVLDLIPNLLFFISIGGLNDLLNNFVHFAYVLLDILKPIVNGYDLLDGLLSNIDIQGYKLNLSLPLNVDFNALFSDLISTFVGDSLNLGGLQLVLPYIDFHTLCCGKLRSFNSSEGRSTVRLDSAEGADLLTAVIRLVFEVLFMEENKAAVTDFVVEKIGTDEEGNPKLDAYDKDTVLQIINQLYTLMETYEVPDMLLFVVYQLVTKLTPLSGKLARSLAASGMTIQDLFSNISDPKSFIAAVSALAGHMGIGGDAVTDTGEITNPGAAMTLLERIRAFFEKIINFFKKIFSIG